MQMSGRRLIVGRIGVAAVALTWTLAMPAASALAQTPSLGEVAKKEAERRKALPPSGKVYTNKDLPPSAQKPAPSSGAGTETTIPLDPVAAATGDKPADAKAEADAKPGEEKNEAWWAGRITGGARSGAAERDVRGSPADPHQLARPRTSPAATIRPSALQIGRGPHRRRSPSSRASNRTSRKASRRSPTSKKRRARPAFLPAGSADVRPRGRSRPDSPRRRQGLAADDAPARAGAAGPCRARGARSARGGQACCSRSSRRSCCPICGCPTATASACCARRRKSTPTCRSSS